MACFTLFFCMNCHFLHKILTHVSILKKTSHCIEVKDITDTQKSASYLLLHVEIDNGGGGGGVKNKTL